MSKFTVTFLICVFSPGIIINRSFITFEIALVWTLYSKPVYQPWIWRLL